MSYSSLTDMFTDVANAIRSKTGEPSNATIQADDFADTIRNAFPWFPNKFKYSDIHIYDNINYGETRTLTFYPIGPAKKLLFILYSYLVFDQYTTYRDVCIISADYDGTSVTKYNIINADSDMYDYRNTIEATLVNNTINVSFASGADKFIILQLYMSN